LVAVGADWTDNRHVLGYLNPLEPGVLNEQPCPIYETTPILDLILHANEHPEPHVLILDEMNLSHVERYFADFLSAMELEDKSGALKLHAAGTAVTRTGVPVPGFIDFPSNLFVIGTVNIDETTYMFSPKVLDRANVIEIHAEETTLGNFLKGIASVGDGSEAKDYGISFLEVAHVIQTEEEHAQVPLLPPTVRDVSVKHLMEIFQIMKRGRGEFGFRTGKEVMAYLRTAHFLAGTDAAARTAWAVVGEPNGGWVNALDEQILQKILPKLHGSRSRLAPLLGALAQYCATGNKDYALEHFPEGGSAAKRTLQDARGLTPLMFKKSYEKLGRMIDVLVEEQFMSFIC
jgi:5-methylcytosine-specific restriction protein B